MLVVKNLPANAGDRRDMGSVPGSGRLPGGGHGNPLQYSCLENPMDRGTWRATVHKVAKSWTQLKRLGPGVPMRVVLGSGQRRRGSQLRCAMDCSPSSSSAHGILQAGILEWVAITFSGGSSRSRDQTHVSCVSFVDRWILCR